MTKEEINQMFEQLKNKEINEVFVKKEQFDEVREVLVARNDFKHFRGIAGHNGHTVYTYLDEPRS
ncbi:abortive phage infection protein [Jeotgalibacillus sp. R-1-5s-1]|uniref:abortive phage infection protein n=1 Tax=Jeotgalibacillus sp. R-1-5s-1 TaxID=2555897 RepID=UPI00106A85C9|nr:abortive phage infection protein [Jeotgalibacillus sp. R-1-5s-1]TFE03679.1 abortive phage infection protein [Jeotgalibacillus sp. R-1-5s-1]